jgi:biotin synthase-related radical SAM superfamily protein
MKELIRVSMGTLRVLGMEILSTGADPTTAYLQTYHAGRCLANCRFCAQARDSSAKDEKIARGTYPPKDTKEVVARLAKAYSHSFLRRVCIQTMSYQGMLEDLVYLVKEIRALSKIPVSVSIFPLQKGRMEELKKAGVDCLVIPLDGATEDIFDEIKGKEAGCPYTWEGHMRALSEAAGVFGKGNVGTHIILGFGESEEDALRTIQGLCDMGVRVALFAYTPVPSSQMESEPPKIGHYRRVQLASHLIEKGLSSFAKMRFEEGVLVDYGSSAKVLDEAVSSGLPFLTRGCPDCNRPYSTESPGGVIYNYPSSLTAGEFAVIRSQLKEQ